MHACRREVRHACMPLSLSKRVARKHICMRMHAPVCAQKKRVARNCFCDLFLISNKAVVSQ